MKAGNGFAVAVLMIDLAVLCNFPVKYATHKQPNTTENYLEGAPYL